MKVEFEEEDLSRYFAETIPFKRTKMEHRYTVELTNASFDKESFEVFKEYELNVH